MATERDPQVVVIGAGLAGLAAALALKRAGATVMVIEAAEAVGGCCSNTRESGYVFNNGAVYVAVPSLLRTGFRQLGLDFDAQVPLAPIRHPHQTWLEDGGVVRLADAERSRVEGPRAAERSARLREGLAALRHDWAPIYRSLVDEVLPFAPSPWRALSRLWRHLPRMRGDAGRLIASRFADPGLQAAIASTLLYTGLPVQHLPASQVIGLVALLEEGFHLPHGGMGAISDALHRELQRRLVPIYCRRRVDRIEAQGGRVRGVVLADGERIAAQCVIATGSGIELVQRLLPEDARLSRMRRQARRAPLSHRAISIQVGGSGDGFAEAFVVNHVPAMREQAAMHRAGTGVPRWLAYTRPTAVLPELAPEGGTVIELYAPVSGVDSAAAWTPEMTRRAVDGHIAALQALLPRLSIDVVRVLDPQDFAQRRHLYEGALYGIAPGTPPQRLFPHRSALNGLYQAGQTTWPGYGVAPAILSGIQAAQALLHDAQ